MYFIAKNEKNEKKATLILCYKIMPCGSVATDHLIYLIVILKNLGANDQISKEMEERLDLIILLEYSSIIIDLRI